MQGSIAAAVPSVPGTGRANGRIAGLGESACPIQPCPMPVKLIESKPIEFGVADRRAGGAACHGFSRGTVSARLACLAGRGKSPPRLFPGMKTFGFCGRFAPGTSSLTCGRLFFNSLLACLAACCLVQTAWSQSTAPKVPEGEARAPDTLSISSEQLLDRLDEKGFHDTVLLVLERLGANDAVSESLRRTIPLRAAKARIGLSRTEIDAAKRVKLFTEAGASLEAFLATGPSGPEKIDALTQLGNLQVERARLESDRARRPGQDTKKLLAAVVPLYDAGFGHFEAAEKEVLEQLHSVDGEIATLRERLEGEKPAEKPAAKPAEKPEGGSADDKKGEEGEKPARPAARKPTRLTSGQRRKLTKELDGLQERQEKLRSQLLQARLLLATALFEKTAALEPASEPWRKTLEASSKRFAEMYEKYQSRGAGLFARYFEGRNYSVLGLALPVGTDGKPSPDRKAALDKAIETLEIIRELRGDSGLAPTLRAKAYNTSLECWLAMGDLAKLDDDAARRVVAAKVPADRLDADWLGMKYRAALLLSKRAAAVEDKNKQKILGNDAAKLAGEVARANRDFVREARDLLTALGKDGFVEKLDDLPFDQQLQDAGVQIAAMQEQTALAKQLAAAGKKEESTAAREKAAGLRKESLRLIDAALASSVEKQPELVNRAKYLKTFLFYDGGQFAEAAEIGADLLENQPNAPGSQQAARIAMAGLQSLARQGGPAAAEARKKSAEIADRIVRIWPEDPASIDAMIVSIAAATEARDPKKILDLLALVPAGQPRRSEVLLRAGGALWREVVGSRRGDAAGRPAPDAVSEWSRQAMASIDEGLALLAKDPAASAAFSPGNPLGSVVLAAALARCQAAIESEDRATVAAILEHPVYGPWTLVTGGVKGAAADFTAGSLAGDALRTSLSFFIQANRLDDAQKAMGLLEKAAGPGDDASRRLTEMYVAMGRDLQQQLEAIGGGGGKVDPDAQKRATKVLGGFEAFLDRVASRDTKPTSLVWVATTYLALGSGGEEGGIGAVVPKAKARDYLTKAAAVYEKLLESSAGADEKTRADLARVTPSIRVKLAAVYRELGRFDECFGHLDKLLADPKMASWLDAQVEAATCLQAAGMAEQDPAKASELLNEAIAGRRTGSSYWGWARLSNQLGRQAFTSRASEETVAKYKPLFFEARLNLARCRVERAERAQGADRQKLYELAENDVVLTAKLYPDLGGPELKGRFDRLLKQVQKALGREQQTGLAGIAGGKEGA
jgi:hypothetical protein